MSRGYGSLFGEGPAVVVGLPSGFDLCAALRRADTIRLATAFAHMSGWRLVEKAIGQSRATVYLLTGLDFCQTEPQVLHSWLTLSRQRRAQAKVHSDTGVTFHPKVLIVDGGSDQDSFAVVGSGNLSAGGLRDNVECCAFLNDRAALPSLRQWYDTLFEGPCCNDLTSEDIESYRPRHNKAKASTRSARRKQSEAQRRIRSHHAALMKRWGAAVAAARRFFGTKAFRGSYAERKKAERRIKRALDYPRFNFDHDGWDAFYAEYTMGHLIEVHKENVWRHRGKLATSLRKLIDEGIPIAERIDYVCGDGSRGHVKHFQMNAATKILAVHRPKLWPVVNKPVRQALADFGYQGRMGVSLGEKYDGLARLMQKFLRETGAADMNALDRFFEHRYFEG